MTEKVNGSKCANVKKNSFEKKILIKGNFYTIHSFFSKPTSDTVSQKIERLIRNEVLKKS